MIGKKSLSKHKVKPGKYAIVLSSDESSWPCISRFITACQRLKLPVYSEFDERDLSQTDGYFISVYRGNESLVKMKAGWVSAFGAKTEFHYIDSASAEIVYKKFNESKLSNNVKVEINDRILTTTITEFAFDKFEKAVMTVARITAQFCPVVKVVAGYDAIEQDYAVISALSELPIPVKLLRTRCEFMPMLSMAKGKSYQELEIEKEEDAIKFLSQIVQTLIVEAKK